MGLLMDILEQNLEKAYDAHVGGIARDARVSLLPAPALPLIFCPVRECTRVFHSEAGLHRHLLSAHTNQFVYLRVNGRVIRDEALFTEPFTSVELIVHGFEQAMISTLQGEVSKTIPFERRHNIAEILPDRSAEVTLIRITLPGDKKPRTFTLFNLNQKPFDSSGIDRDAFNMLFVHLNDRKKPLFSEFSACHLGPRVPLVSRKYAEGMFDYANAFQLSMQGEGSMAKGHFEWALSRLCNYGSPMALTATRVLALRMNVFALLLNAIPPSFFSEANSFFNNIPLDMSRGSGPQVRMADESGVFYDDEIEMLLAALSAYFKGDFIECRCQAGELQRLSKDVNNKAKALLLEARAAMKSGDSASALSRYQALEFHPDFGDEANSILTARGGNDQGC